MQGLRFRCAADPPFPWLAADQALKTPNPKALPLKDESGVAGGFKVWGTTKAPWLETAQNISMYKWHRSHHGKCKNNTTESTCGL